MCEPQQSDTLRERFFRPLSIKARLGFGSSCAMHAALVHLTPHPLSCWSVLLHLPLPLLQLYPLVLLSFSLLQLLLQPYSLFSHTGTISDFHIVLLPLLPQVIVGSLLGQTKCW